MLKQCVGLRLWVGKSRRHHQLGPLGRTSRNSASNHPAQFTLGRESPNLCILAIRVVRFTPRLAAAPCEPPTTHPRSSSARRIRSRSISFSVDGGREVDILTIFGTGRRL